jgi:oligosaccharide repeat unit polymerase
MFAGFIGCLAIYVGYYSPFGAKIGTRIPALSGKWYGGSLQISIAIMLAVSGLLFLLLVRQLGGFGSLISFASGRSQTRTEFLTNSSGYIYSAPLWIRSVGVLLMAISPRWLSFQSLTGLLLVIASQSTQLGAGNRSSFLPILLSVALLVYLKIGSRPRLISVIGCSFLVFIFVITLPREYRDIANREQSLSAVVSQTVTSPRDAFGGFFEGLDTAMVGALALEIGDIPARADYQFGSTYFDDLMRPIPRSLWSEKPRSGDEQVMQIVYPDYYRQGVQIYSSMFGEPYFNFGYLGIVVFGFMFGIAWRSLYAWFMRDPANTTMQAIYALNWPFVFVYFRGGVGVDYQRQATGLLPVLLIVAIAHVRQNQQSISVSEPIEIENRFATPRPSVRALE